MFQLPLVYDAFWTGQSRDDIVQTAEKMADFMHDRKINNIVIADKQARPSYIGLTRVWKKKYPDEPRPNIYFINTEPFRDNIKYPSGEAVEKFKEEIDELYPVLAKNKSDSVLVFDNCFHTGRSITPVLKAFREIGYDVHYGTALPMRGNDGLMSEEKDLPEFSTLNHLVTFCDVFGTDKMVADSDDFFSKRNGSSRSLKNRGEIHKILNEAGY